MKHLSLIATAISSIGGFLFGYDIGVISGVLAMPTFPTFFGMQGDPNHIAKMKGDVVSLLQAGCCVGALLINFIADPFGRKWSIVLSSLVFIVGSILQVVAQNLPTMMAGRFIGGMGVGGCSMLVPMYIAEIAPRKLRGRLGTLWQFLIVLGIMMSYWIDYACLRHIPTGDTQWRVPLGIQIAPGFILGVGMVFLPESLRWLALKGRAEDVKKNLLRLRDLPEDHPSITEELCEINVAAEFERESKSGKWTELFQRSNLHRLFIGIMLQIFQQWTGTNAINYYAPEIFRSAGLDSNEVEILATGVYGIVKVAFVFISFFMVDTKLGRRKTLMIGSAVMMIAFYILGGMILGIQRDNGGGGFAAARAKIDAKGYVAMVMIYVFAVGYEFSWGPIVWIVCSEIYPTRIRAMALSLTTAFNWAMNATIAKVTPIMMTNITYGTYFFFGSCAVVMGVFAFVFLPETRGRSLEEMDALFNSGMILTYKDTYKVDKEQIKRDEEAGIFKD
ncbi:general substrate transporter [Mycotypha africana]|uniref:general substrate transporter n=1 Tax=Mycotypha africana TaxID=64632 RepID=UPI002301920C|nr:general substrate transporter [Mycotypha africana]KAI8969312.1 general substrate transporter [Mycotypha africana]